MFKGLFFNQEIEEEGKRAPGFYRNIQWPQNDQ